GRSRPARLSRMVTLGQLRVVRGLPPPVRHRVRGLCDPAAGAQGQRAVVSRRDPAERSAVSRTRRPTLEAVAARAGVSRATVSRVVNGQPTVTPEIRAQVMRAIEELGYIPNSAARSLVTKRTDSYALVASEPPSRVFSDDPLFSIVIRTVSVELEAADKQVVLMLASSPRSHARIERYIAGGH